MSLVSENVNIDYSPGMRVLIRDEEWLIRSVTNNSFGNKTLFL